MHALAFDSNRWSLLLDLDYIFQWVKPADGETYYRFWIAPATMRFHDVYNLRFDIETDSGLEIAELHRGEPSVNPNTKKEESTYTLDCQEGSISFQSSGYRMTVRRTPILTQTQVLEPEQRGGFSFDENSNATSQ
jgi:hypothetical protein